MKTPHRSLPVLALSLGAATMASPAEAQQYRPDEEAFPCAAQSLTIKPDAQGFAIVRTDALAKPRPAPVEAAVAKLGVRLGTALQIDRILLEHGAKRREVSDAPAR